MGRNVVSTLANIYGTRCHYCSNPTNRRNHDRLQATKEHVVPRMYGGENHISNYLLACRACNEKRGTNLFFCDCPFCTKKINEFLSDNNKVQTVVANIFAFNKPKVRRVQNGWTVKYGHNTNHFESFKSAIAFATTL